MKSAPRRNLILRRCKGNTEAWVVILLRRDGTESELYCCQSTGLSPGSAVTNAIADNLILPGDTVLYQP